MYDFLLTVLHRGAGDQEQVLAYHHEFDLCPLSSTTPVDNAPVSSLTGALSFT